MALQGFNKEYYLNAKLEELQNNPDTSAEWQGSNTAELEAVLQSDFGLTPEQHYVRYGYQEDLAPNAYFNAEEYTQAKAQDLLEKGEYQTYEEARTAFETRWQANPYEHYIQYGASEGINPSNAFDASAYFQEKLTALQNDPDTAAQWTDSTVEDVQQAFAEAGLTPLGHYVAYGDEENLTAPEVPADEAVPGTGEPTDPAPEEPTDPAPEEPTDPAPEEPTDPAPEEPTDPAPEEPTDPAPEEPTDPTPEEPTDPTPEEPITEDEIYEVDAQNVGTNYDLSSSELSEYSAIRFSGIDRAETVNIQNLEDKRLYATDSSLALNIAAASVAQVELENSDVTLYGQEGNPVLETLNVTVQEGDGSGSALDLSGSAADALTSVTLSGAGDLNLTGATVGAQATDATSIDASGMAGSLTTAEGVLDEADSIQAGSGDDNLTIDGVGAADSGTAPTIDGGEGNDTLVVTGSEDIVSSVISNIETLQTDSYVTIDAGEVPDVTNFVVSASGSEIQGLASDQTVISMVDEQPGDAPSLNLRDAAETVNVVTDFSESAQGQALDLGVYTSSGETEIEGGTLNLSGNGDVVYTEAGRKFGTIDASSLEAGLDFTGANYVQENVVLGESEAADTIAVTTLDSNEQTILTSSYGEDDMDSIQNFNLTTDQIVVDDGSSVIDFTSAGLDVSGAADLEAAFTMAADSSAGADDYVAFQFEENTYVYANSEAPADSTGVALSDNDFAIELMGVSLPEATTNEAP